MNYFLHVFIFILLTCTFSSYAQIDMKDYEGHWEGILKDPQTYNFEVSVAKLAEDEYSLTISNGESFLHKTVKSSLRERLQFELGNGLNFRGLLSEDESEISGFFHSGILLYHVLLKKGKGDKYVGTWNVFMVDSLQPQSIYLNVEDAEGEDYAAYPFWGDQRFTGTWCTNFEKEDDTLLFADFKTGMQFRGKLLPEKIELEMLLAGTSFATVGLERSTEDWDFDAVETNKNREYQAPIRMNDGWEVASLKASNIDYPKLQQMVDSMYANSLTYTHSVLIAKKGELVYEKYFYDYNPKVSHDQRSAAKSISAAMIGIAIADGLVDDAQQSLYDFIPPEYQYTKDSLKAKISLQDLLTMSSGIDAVDFGIKRNSAASEDSYQSSPDWLKTVLEAPMINEPGSQANYGSANPYLLGVALRNVVSSPVELYMDQKLLNPLGISNYIIQTDNTGKPYFGGGMYLTPRDMLKFGQLYLQKGKWGKERLISKRWVKESTQNYRVLENTTEKNGYGYLWWHETYEISGQKIPSFEARGAGGQVIFVIPKLDLVAVITSGNFRNGRYWQPQMIMREYILPAVVGE